MWEASPLSSFFTEQKSTRGWGGVWGGLLLLLPLVLEGECKEGVGSLLPHPPFPSQVLPPEPSSCAPAAG